jgi:hypothetical protein
LSGTQCDNFVASLEVHDMSDIRSESDKFGTSENRTSVNSLHTYHLGNNIHLTIETQTGLCNITKMLKDVDKQLIKGKSLHKWYRLTGTKKLLEEFNESHKDDVVQVFNGTEVVPFAIIDRVVKNEGTVKATVWLHKELAAFYVPWLGIKTKDITFSSIVFDTKMAFLRDRSASMFQNFKLKLDTLVYTQHETYKIPVAVHFSRKFSKLIFGFNEDGVNQWDEATDEQLLLRIVLLTYFATMHKFGKLVTYQELKEEMNKIGKTCWLYWDGSTGKRRLKASQSQLVNAYISNNT